MKKIASLLMGLILVTQLSAQTKQKYIAPPPPPPAPPAPTVSKFPKAPLPPSVPKSPIVPEAPPAPKTHNKKQIEIKQPQNQNL